MGKAIKMGDGGSLKIKNALKDKAKVSRFNGNSVESNSFATFSPMGINEKITTEKPPLVITISPTRIVEFWEGSPYWIIQLYDVTNGYNNKVQLDANYDIIVTYLNPSNANSFGFINSNTFVCCSYHGSRDKGDFVVNGFKIVNDKIIIIPGKYLRVSKNEEKGLFLTKDPNNLNKCYVSLKTYDYYSGRNSLYTINIDVSQSGFSFLSTSERDPGNDFVIYNTILVGNYIISFMPGYIIGFNTVTNSVLPTIATPDSTTTYENLFPTLGGSNFIFENVGARSRYKGNVSNNKITIMSDVIPISDFSYKKIFGDKILSVGIPISEFYYDANYVEHKTEYENKRGKVNSFRLLNLIGDNYWCDVGVPGFSYSFLCMIPFGYTVTKLLSQLSPTNELTNQICVTRSAGIYGETIPIESIDYSK